MKRVSLVIALFLVSLFALPSCESEVDEMVVDELNTEKMTADEDEHDGGLPDLD